MQYPTQDRKYLKNRRTKRKIFIKYILTFTFTCVLSLNLLAQSEEQEPADDETPDLYFAIPLSASLHIPLALPPEEWNLESRFNVDALLQFLAPVDPVVSVGGEIGLSATIFVPLAFLITGAFIDGQGEAISPAASAVFGNLNNFAIHFPLRFVTNFYADDGFDADLYTGIVINVFARHQNIDFSIDVGTRLFFSNFFLDLSYILPVNAYPDFSYWGNALSIAFGYRISGRDGE